MVLVRNLSTHKYGGWYISIENGIENWGEAVINMLKGEAWIG